jgi:hypothetical protein
MILGAALTPDGGRLITVASSIYDSGDEVARIWDSLTGEKLGELRGHTGLIATVLVTPDGRHVVTGSADKTARIWELFPTGQALVDEAKRVAPRCLTMEQRRQFHLSPTPPGWCDSEQKWPYDDVTLGQAHFAAGHWRDAITAFERAMKSERGKSPMVSAWLGMAYNGAAWATFLEVDLGRQPSSALTQALAEADKAMTLYPDPGALDTRGQIHLALGQIDEALADLDAALAQGVTSPATYFAHGKAQERKHNTDAAIADYRQALAQKASDDEYERVVRGRARERLMALAPPDQAKQAR